jgi:hypothetical protein
MQEPHGVNGRFLDRIGETENTREPSADRDKYQRLALATQRLEAPVDRVHVIAQPFDG